MLRPKSLERDASSRWEAWLLRANNDTGIYHYSDRGSVALISLPENLRREIRYALYHHAQNPRRTCWRPAILRRVVARLAQAGIRTLGDPVVADLAAEYARGTIERRILLDLPIAVRTLVADEQSSKLEGWFDPVLVGAKPFVGSQSVSSRRQPWDLTAVSQRWLRDLLWDYLRDESLLPESKRCTKTTVFMRIQSTVALSYALRHIREDGGNDLSQISGEDAKAFKTMWDLWYREKVPLPFGRSDGKDAGKPLSQLTRYVHTVHIRTLLEHSRDRQRTTRNLELFAFNLPSYAPPTKAPRPRPLTSEVYEQLVAPENVSLLEQADADDVGWADIWLTHAFQGGRIGETLRLRLGCIGLVGRAQPYIWRDITKVNVVDYGMPCHLPIYERLLERQQKTRARLRQRYASEWSALTEDGQWELMKRWDADMPLFAATTQNIDLELEVSQARFHTIFAAWVKKLGLKGVTTHQTRATLATSMLNNGAPPELVSQLLGHFSSQSLAHYARYNDTTMRHHLQQLWAAGPGMNKPGQILLTPEEVKSEDGYSAAARIDLTVVPVEHGLCRYGPVVGGANCPFDKQCSAGPQGPCEHFVLTGADLSYWERKRDAAFHFAEGAPSEEARDYIMSQWDPWGPVLQGLREALRDRGLLEAATKLDLRNPLQDYFDPLFASAWSIPELTRPSQVGPPEEKEMTA